MLAAAGATLALGAVVPVVASADDRSTGAGDTVIVTASSDPGLADRPSKTAHLTCPDGTEAVGAFGRVSGDPTAPTGLTSLWLAGNIARVRAMSDSDGDRRPDGGGSWTVEASAVCMSTDRYSISHVRNEGAGPTFTRRCPDGSTLVGFGSDTAGFLTSQTQPDSTGFRVSATYLAHIVAACATPKTPGDPPPPALVPATTGMPCPAGTFPHSVTFTDGPLRDLSLTDGRLGPGVERASLACGS